MRPLATVTAVFVLSIVFLTACATTPITKRTQVMLVGEEQMVALGAQMYRQMESQSDINHNRRANRIVRRVGHRLAAVANKPNYEWEFIVIDDPDMINAWVLPGGKVGVYTGMFPVAHDEAGLAIILGHEAAHALARHAGERMSQGLLLQMGAQGVAASLGGADPAVARQLYQAFGLGATVGVILPFSRLQEVEADRIGLILAAKAGYDPRTALAVWQRMAALEREQPHSPEFLSTHPHYATRLQNIEGWLPEALQYYESSVVQTSEKLPHLS